MKTTLTTLTTLRSAVLLATAMAFAMLPAAGQQTNVGGITGTVHDATGAVVPDAQVTAQHQEVAVTQTAQSSGSGVYFIPLLPIGQYTVSVTKDGFKTATRTDVNVFGGQTITFDFDLAVGAVTQQVEVIGEAPVLDTTSGNSGVTTPGKLLAALPIVLIGQASRSAIQSVAYLPGVETNSSGGQNWTIISRAQINGIPPGMFGYEIDGLYAGAGAAESAEERVTPVPEQIAEVRLTTNTDASAGFNGGVTLDMVSRSGTNSLHGSVYEYVRNQSLNARNALLNQPNTIQRPQDNQNEWGFTVGGPIPWLNKGRNKTYFFVAMDWFRYRFNLSNSGAITSTVPTAAMRNGDFREWLTGTMLGTDFLGRPVMENQVYDPATTRAVTAGVLDPVSGIVSTGTGTIRDPVMFGGQMNVIDPARVSTVSDGFQVGYALPTVSGIVDNWSGLPRQSLIDKDQLSWKVDQHIGDSHRMSLARERQVNWFHRGGDELRRGNNGHFFIYGGDGYLDRNINNGFIDDRDMYRYRFNYVWTVRPDLLFNFRAGVNRSSGRRNGSFPTGTNLPAAGHALAVGLTGTLTGNTPAVGIDGVSGFGLGFEGALMADQATPVNLDLTWAKGSHSIKFGAQYIAFPFSWERQQALSHAVGGSGNFGFARQGTGEPQFSGETGVGYASYFLGQVNNSELSTPLIGRNYTASMGLFFTDSWRATRKLTINYGIRWEHNTPMTELHQKISTFDPMMVNPGSVGRLGALSIYGSGAGRNGFTSLNESYWKEFAPKIGFAYSPDPKTVIRLSYGVSYIPMLVKYYNGAGQMAPSDGFALAQTETSLDNGITPAFNWDNGFPLNIPALPSIDPTLLNGRNIALWDRGDNRPPMVQNFGFQVGRQLPGQISFEIGYVGTLSHRLPGNIDLNALPLSELSRGSLLTQPFDSAAAVAAGITEPFVGFGQLYNPGGHGTQPSVAQSLLRYPQYLRIQSLNASLGKQNYHALQMTATKHFGDLNFLASYAWYKTLSDIQVPCGCGNSFGGSQAIQSQHPDIRETGRMLSAGGGTPPAGHVIKLNYAYDLPFGSGKRYMTNATGAVNAILGGWKFSGIHIYQPGNLLRVTSAQSIPGVQSVWPILNTGVPINSRGCGDIAPGDASRPYLNIAAFSTPAPFTLGNVSATPGVLGCRYANEDFGLEKMMAISEKFTFKFGTLVHNAFNRHQLRNIGTSLGTPSSFGLPSGTTTGRLFQLYARIDF